MVSPSRIARTVAGHMWPDVQQQTKITTGVYTFSCAGHGGLVAVIGEADLPADAVAAARACGLIELVAVVREGRRTRIFSSAPSDSRNGNYTRESLEDFARRNPQRVSLVEVWIGEEDCAWATIALVSPAVRDGLVRIGCAASAVTGDGPYATVQRWNEEFLVALDPFYTISEDGPIDRRRRHAALLADGHVVRVAALGLDDGQVHVCFRGSGDREEYYLMDTSTYRAIPLTDSDATPDTYREHGPIEQAQGPLGHPDGRS